MDFTPPAQLRSLLPMKLRPFALALILSLVGIVTSSADEPKLTPLFNGRDLTGWDGDPRLWSVRTGVIRGSRPR